MFEKRAVGAPERLRFQERPHSLQLSGGQGNEVGYAPHERIAIHPPGPTPGVPERICIPIPEPSRGGEQRIGDQQAAVVKRDQGPGKVVAEFEKRYARRRALNRQVKLGLADEDLERRGLHQPFPVLGGG